MHYLLILILISSSTVCAKDFGVHGATFEIAEENLIEVLKNSANKINGEALQQKTIDKVNDPKALTNVSRTSEPRVFFYDPSFTVQENEFDVNGKLLFIKGQKINPLHKVSLSKQLVFFDGRDPEQVKFISALKHKNSKLILTGGSPSKLSESLNSEIFFDQQGNLTNKFGIKQVPTIVSQDGTLLKIEEVSLDESN